VLSTGEQKLYELTQAGQVLAYRDLSGFLISNPQGMTFAPSGDQTDDPAQMSLYIADSGQNLEANTSTQLQLDSTTTLKTSADLSTSGQIVELSLVEPMAAAATNFTSSTVKITDMSAIDPPSPDPSGIAYIPSRNTLVIVDGEVEETVSGITHFEGASLWELTMGGNKIRTANISKIDYPGEPSRIDMTNEPVGVAWNPYTGHYLVSQDDGDTVFDEPRPDGWINTADDT
jgi:DNA-binding beta-propeller fold protein YncE